tara:strand:+ start:202 stop:909 length:708 start_codon:yes stop_codon:yes gene_type:complete
MSVITKQPIVILGGFLINSKTYDPMAKYLERKINNKVVVVKINKYEWLLTIWSYGWKRILNLLDKEVEILQKKSPTGKVTLIGHSSGGVMLRLYLTNRIFAGKIYNGSKICDYLITLGSPHQATKATRLRSMVDKLYPGCYYSNLVKYISVAGKIDLESNLVTNLARRTALASYRSITGKKVNEGDGLVPIESALLNGSKNIIINNTAHGKTFGKYWYGSNERIDEWWEIINNSK